MQSGGIRSQSSFWADARATFTRAMSQQWARRMEIRRRTPKKWIECSEANNFAPSHNKEHGKIILLIRFYGMFISSDAYIVSFYESISIPPRSSSCPGVVDGTHRQILSHGDLILRNQWNEFDRELMCGQMQRTPWVSRQRSSIKWCRDDCCITKYPKHIQLNAILCAFLHFRFHFLHCCWCHQRSTPTQCPHVFTFTAFNMMTL